MPVTGNGPKRIQSLREQIGAIGTPQFRSAFGRAIAATAVKQVRDGFRASRDPYGKPWKPLTSRTGKPLEDTGALVGSLAGGKRPQATVRGFAMGTNRKGATVHQYGATIVPVNAKALAWKQKGFKAKRVKDYAYVAGKKILRGSLPPPKWAGWRFTQKVTIPRRQFMPENDTGGLGKIWGDAFDREAEEFMADYMAGV